MNKYVIDKFYLMAWDALEEYLMGEFKDVAIWGNEGCQECEAIKRYFAKSGYVYTDVQELISGEKADVDALVQLSFQQMRLPLLRIDGEWVDPVEIRSFLGEEVA